MFEGDSGGLPYNWSIALIFSVTDTTKAVIGISSEGDLIWNRKTNNIWQGWKKANSIDVT